MSEEGVILVDFEPAMMPALLELWDAATAGTLPLAARLWRQNVDNSRLFHPGDCRVSLAASGKPIGVVLTRILSEADLAANPDMGSYRGLGHLMALAVHPGYQRQGIGSGLLKWAEERLRRQGATTICLWGPPGHMLPGPPADEAILPFWLKHGYTLKHTTYDVRASLDTWRQPEQPAAVDAGDFTFVRGQTGQEREILAFLSDAFPGRWRFDMSRSFEQGYKPSDVTLLRSRSGAIKGFLCAFHEQSGFLGGGTLLYPLLRPGAWGGIGPLGVSEEVRGLGLGLALVAAGVSYLHARGVRDCVIDWTSLVDFYGHLGFTPWKSYYSLEKDITATST